MGPRSVRSGVVQRIGAMLALAAVLAVPKALQGQTDFQRRQIPAPPPYYAIQNARLVTVSGAVIQRGTIVVENGIITGVGPSVTIPPEARVIDGEGLTVYPGLIDAMSTLGHPTARRANGPPRRSGAAGAGAGTRGLEPALFRG